MATDAFGLSDTPPEVALGLVEVEGEEPEAEAEQEPTVEQSAQATEEAPSETPEAPEVEAETQIEEVPQTTEEVEAETEVEAGEPEVEETPRLWANKYENPEALEKGYNESRDMWRRAQEARKAEEQARYEAEVREAEMAKIITEALPYLQQAAAREEQLRVWAERYHQETGQYPEGLQFPQPQAGTPGGAPLGPADVDRMVQARLEQERIEMQERLRREAEVRAVNEAVTGFYSDHPEVEPRGTADNEITDAMRVLNDAWATRDEEVDMADRGSIEVLYEASKRPALLEVLALRPEYFDSERGLQLARMEASYLEGAPLPSDTQQTRVVPASKVGETTGQRKPFAESAVSGAEAEESEDENDPWVQVKREYAKSKTTASVFEFE